MKIIIEIEVIDDEENIDYHFKSSEPISLRDFSYYVMEALSGLLNDWVQEEDE